MLENTKKWAFIKKQYSKLPNGEWAFCFDCYVSPYGRLKSLDSIYNSRCRMSILENFLKEDENQRSLKIQKKLEIP